MISFNLNILIKNVFTKKCKVQCIINVDVNLNPQSKQ